MSNSLTWYYAFQALDDWKFPIYNRTFGTERAARSWATKKKGRFITINSLPRRYYS